MFYLLVVKKLSVEVIGTYAFTMYNSVKSLQLNQFLTRKKHKITIKTNKNYFIFIFFFILKLFF